MFAEFMVVPFKADAACRHPIPKQRDRVTNSPAFDAALRQRGSLTVWFIDAAIAAWKTDQGRFALGSRVPRRWRSPRF